MCLTFDETPGCPGSGDCFVANGTPGCEDDTCCSSVCAVDPFCCDNEWDQTCADEAADLCRPPASEVDGWVISFHEPLAEGQPATPADPLGLYFCDATAVTTAPTELVPCDSHPVNEYLVELSDCCLIHSTPDSRSGFTPAGPGAFDEEQCFRYDIDIQAVVGFEYADIGGGICVAGLTGTFAENPFWGWHTTAVDSGIRKALQSPVVMNGPQWQYGPWQTITPSCATEPVNMAFELLTTVAVPSPNVPSDFDGDCDVDSDDTNAFEDCYTGPEISLIPGCEDKDLDADGDVDTTDHGKFQRCVSGPGQPPDPNCVN
jgi:hypothetical protein